ncbi:MAG TPA: class I SAM-dependent methyltransferase [Opitutus sp.]|nr:class I SAM-dependent methyltransferase [Opitutus sp.]
MDRAAEIDQLDIRVFDPVLSVTGTGDRHSLLAVQRSVARRHGSYVYLEIGSYQGGSLQPHLVDPRCRRIFSIDPRVLQMPDDRARGCVIRYAENSLAGMLANLARVPGADLAKLRTFESDSAALPPGAIVPRCHLVFIDGNHTQAAVLSDFRFAAGVASDDAVILFHDTFIVHPAIKRACRELRRQGRRFRALFLKDDIFALFLDPSLVDEDPYLSSQVAATTWSWLAYRLRGFCRRLGSPRHAAGGRRDISAPRRTAQAGSIRPERTEKRRVRTVDQRHACSRANAAESENRAGNPALGRASGNTLSHRAGADAGFSRPALAQAIWTSRLKFFH